MKKHLHVTLDDLEAIAKDAKNGFSTYHKLSINWDGEAYTYFYDELPIKKIIAIEYLKEQGYYK